MFHSGRVTLRNRRFLREYTTIHPERIRPLSIETQTSVPTPSTAGPEPTPPASDPALSTPVPPIPTSESEGPIPSSSDLPTQSQESAPGDSQTTIITKKLPRALKNLQSFNKPGLKDDLPSGGRR